jgi:penicillin-binding protein 2
MSVRGLIKDSWRERRLFEQRTIVVVILIGLLSSLLLGRLLWLQVLRYDHYTQLSQGNRVRVEPLPAARGIIYDRRGEVLADNQPTYQLELIPEEVPDVETTLAGLVRIGLIEAAAIEDLKKLIRSRRSFESIPVRLRLDDQEIARFAVNRFRFPGVDIQTRLARNYPLGEIGVHALGYVGAISEADLKNIAREAYAGTSTIGKLGIESAYEQDLRGENGRREQLVNARGRPIENLQALERELIFRPSRRGQDLFLTLDLNVQNTAEKAMANRRGALIALDPNNGDVLALVSHPGFDPNLFARGLSNEEFSALNTDPDRPLFNRALRGTYPPGSTIKPLVALAGLQYGVITPEDVHYCVGYFTLPGSSRRFRDWQRRGHGPVNMRAAISRSCDPYFYSLADRLGVDRLHNFLGQFGLEAPSGIDIGGEKSGILPSREWKRSAFRNPQEQVWFPGETVIFGIGQGYMTSTPLQVAQMTATLAMRGAAWRPRLVAALRDPQTGERQELAPEAMPVVTLKDNNFWKIAIDGMRAVMEGGTASAAARGARYSIAGKSGTAQVVAIAQGEQYDADALDERLRDHAWFVAFAPIEAPRIVVAVLIENGGGGSGVAAPVARQVMDAYLLPQINEANGT